MSFTCQGLEKEGWVGGNTQFCFGLAKFEAPMSSVQNRVGSEMHMSELETKVFWSLEAEMLGDKTSRTMCCPKKNCMENILKKSVECLLGTGHWAKSFVFTIPFNYSNNYCYPCFSDEQTEAQFKEPDQSCTANKRQVYSNAKFMLLIIKASLLLKAVSQRLAVIPTPGLQLLSDMVPSNGFISWVQR